MVSLRVQIIQNQIANENKIDFNEIYQRRTDQQNLTRTEEQRTNMNSQIIKRTVLLRNRNATNLHVIRSLSHQVIPDLKGLDKRWSKMKELDQADVIDYLNSKTSGDWHQLTTQEKQSLYYIYYGNWGPRSDKPQKGVSAIVLQGLFGGVLTIAIGVGLMNYAFDYEQGEKVDNLLERIEKESK
ncbi:hypothetical protein BN7_1549 [Wickerhamomyces ciferrii]|uniref:Uncharacterized protein n=1 Tax=Wickerhamomyces ciferrii (strain ATCC 14091 / BCRC 22168 / CBS 111 / JCM 3599 / NBRC 0793 / NRRL Y-1031 F-60-10) TaxID=1206466 RepID=K0KAK2_WICCF|nr:uncharacterized protein BN7_1549 [Wickerhamomyces ciferrii]CCH42010.1 hypothetical protein BN7_1549 [Wickerhamomyces ciferrii]